MTNPQPNRLHIAGEVRAGLARKGMTQGDLATEMGLSRTTLNGRLKGDSAFDTDELFVISSVLDIAFALFWPEDVTAKSNAA